MTFKELFSELIGAFVSMGHISFALWKLSPVVMSIATIWITGVSWNVYTLNRSLLLSLIWFVPSKYLEVDVSA